MRENAPMPRVPQAISSAPISSPTRRIARHGLPPCSSTRVSADSPASVAAVAPRATVSSASVEAAAFSVSTLLGDHASGIAEPSRRHRALDVEGFGAHGQHDRVGTGQQRAGGADRGCRGRRAVVGQEERHAPSLPCPGRR